MSGAQDVEIKAVTGGRWRAIVAAGLLAAIVAVLALFPFSAWLESAAHWIDAHGNAGRFAYIALFVAATVLMVPGSILFALAGYLFGLAEGAPLAWLSVPLGSGAAAFVARHLLRERLLGRFRDDARFVAIDRAVAGKAWTIVTLSRLSLLMPFNLLNVIYGLSRIRLSTMTIATALGMTPSVFLYTWLGATAKDLDRIVSGDYDAGWVDEALIVASVVVIVLVTVIIHRTATRALKQELEHSREL